MERLLNWREPERVDYLRNSDQKQRWLATFLLDIEPRLKRIKGYQNLPKLRLALQKEIETKLARKQAREEVDF